LRQRPEVKSVFVDGGHISPATSEVRVASVIINYTPKEERKATQRQLELSIGHDLENIPDIRSWFVDENGMRGISLVVTGQSNGAVRNVAAELAAQMRRIPSVANIVSSGSLDRPEIRIRPRPELTARLGIVTESLAETIRIATIGDVEPALAKMISGDRQVPVRVQLDQSIRGDLQRLEQLRVPMPGGRGSAPLGSIASVALEEGPINIPRYDREQQAGVAADLVEGKVLSQAMADIDQLPVMKYPPPGIKISASGDSESMNDLAAGFSSAMRNGLIMVFALLVLLFRGVFQPVTILFSLPLSLGGAFLGLLVANRPLSVPVFIGILMLMGIVTKNAIMLVDFTILAIERGVPRAVAAVDAGTKRARPIVMTTVAMVAGMLPSAFAHGAGGEIRSPMAIAVIGGLVVSTLLSLVFVPAMYLAMDDLNRLFLRLLSPLLSSKGEAPADPARKPPREKAPEPGVLPAGTEPSA
jgi:multidrug efflux pump subunit AcrB